MSMLTKDIANTILRQLGGQRFILMTGAKNFISRASMDALGILGFQLPGKGGYTKDGINQVEIALMPSDTYTMTFNRVRKGKNSVVPVAKEIAKVTDVYFDQLQAVFTQHTGLETHL